MFSRPFSLNVPNIGINVPIGIYEPHFGFYVLKSDFSELMLGFFELKMYQLRCPINPIQDFLSQI
jgi:hypothetical protein